jgi:ribosomal-protein-alanine N-acetyltransferase
MQELSTRRLLLRPFAPADAEAIHTAVYGDPLVCEHFCGLPWSLEQVRSWLAYHHLDTRYGDLGYLAVERRADQRVLGLVGLRPYVAAWIAWQDAPREPFSRLEMELTYALGQAWWGHGYATEACAALIGYAFTELRLQRLAYSVCVHNVPSWKLMKRLGFRFQRNLRPESGEEVVGILDNTLLTSEERRADAACAPLRR